MRNTAGIVEETSTDYPSQTPGFTPVVLGGRSGSRPLFWGWVGFTPVVLGVGRVSHLISFLSCVVSFFVFICWSSSLLCSMLSLLVFFLVVLNVVFAGLLPCCAQCCLWIVNS